MFKGDILSQTQDRGHAMTSQIPDLKSMIQHVIRGVLPSSSTNLVDVDLVTRLCMMAAVPTGDEDPREILGGMSNDIINAFALNLERIQKNAMSAPVAQLFFIEWCFRHGHLNDDWKWEWDSSVEGHVAYNPKEPLEQLVLKINQTC